MATALLNRRAGTLLAALLLAWAPSIRAADGPPASGTGQGGAAQDPAAPPPQRVELYGHAMLDMGYDFGQVDPKWFDVLRPTKLPSSPNQFGEDGTFFAGVRQSRFGVRGFSPTSLGEMKAHFEFEMFGTGVDAGQTTFRLRHFYGELGHFGAGQTWSPFMDSDMFPNTLEHWGPVGMVSFRNVQVRWMPLREGSTTVTLAVERPGASGDQGVYSDRIELKNVKGRFPLPDFSGNVRRKTSWGYVQVAGMLRRINWDDVLDDQYDLSGGATGWGVHVSSNVKAPGGVFRGSVVYGAGIENYMNDAPVDIGIRNNFSDPRTPIVGKALPVLGITAYYDARWTDKWTSTMGYSFMDVENADGQAGTAFRRGHYVVTNLLHHPMPGLFFGGELQWGRRENFSDGFSYDDVRIQFAVKYTFKYTVAAK